jgi:hypothetical protein
MAVVVFRHLHWPIFFGLGHHGELSPTLTALECARPGLLAGGIF